MYTLVTKTFKLTRHKNLILTKRIFNALPKLTLTLRFFSGFRRRPIYPILPRLRRLLFLLQQPLSPIQQPGLLPTVSRKTVCRCTRRPEPAVCLQRIPQQIRSLRSPSFRPSDLRCCPSGRPEVHFRFASLQRRGGI